MAKLPASYRVRLNEKTAEGLASFLEHRDHWSDVIDVALQVRAASSMSAFCHHVADQMELEFDVVADILAAIRSLKLGQSDSGRTAEEVVGDVTNALSRRVGSQEWSDDSMQAWTASSEEIVGMLTKIDKDSSLMLSSKAQRLVFDRSSILRDVRVITDIRPVFDSAAENIREMVVIHTLVIRYEDREGFKELYVAIDGDDLEDIQNECIRAAAKSQVAKRSLHKHEWRTVEYPEVQTDEESETQSREE